MNLNTAMLNVKGRIFNIQRFSVQDGPGIRSVVFFKGCPLKCLWCCNPESQSLKSDILYDFRKCIQCQSCVRICPQKAIEDREGVKYIDINKCDYCMKCVDSCFAGALSQTGDDKTIDEVMNEILRDVDIYRNSNGGVTLGGGEPLMQIEYAKLLLSACHSKNIHTAIETCGYVSWDSFEVILPYTDLFLFDLKHMDAKVHSDVTSKSNKKILSNLKRLSELNKTIIIRLPLIPGVNMDNENIEATIQLLQSICLNQIHLLPYHRLGVHKYKELGQEYLMPETAQITDFDIEEIYKKYSIADFKVTLYNHS